jgi:hypothetical protein
MQLHELARLTEGDDEITAKSACSFFCPDMSHGSQAIHHFRISQWITLVTKKKTDSPGISRSMMTQSYAWPVGGVTNDDTFRIFSSACNPLSATDVRQPLGPQ